MGTELGMEILEPAGLRGNKEGAIDQTLLSLFRVRDNGVIG
jgi:hypothetical protein